MQAELKERTIKRASKSRPTMEGAGVHLKRAFGNQNDNELDPFLLLDDFKSNNPDDYIAGFPWHPHRGIETITYMLYGKVEHEDSMGNKGVIRHGDVQWMTAGSGIIHQEMPKFVEGDSTLMGGFQLWANLPSHQKMMHPRYQGIKNEEIPEITLENGAVVRIICGNIDDVKGPVQDIVTDPEYIDVKMPPNSEFKHPIRSGYTLFAYVIDGEGYFDNIYNKIIGKETLVVYKDGDLVNIHTKDKPVRFLLVSGKPIGEPVAWYGPIVMNTREELETAFREYNNGSFLKHK